MRPPPVARWIVRAACPSPLRDEMIGELDTEYRAYILPSRGSLRARLWYWRQALASIPRLLLLRRSVVVDAAADLRFALRQFTREPLATASAILTLALGIGGTAAIFSAAYPVLFRPLPYEAPDRIVHLFEAQPAGNRLRAASFPDFFDWRAAGFLSHLAGYSGGAVTLTGEGRADRLRTILVTDEFLDVLGVSVAQGRDFGPDDFKAGAPRTVILTHRAWQGRFAGRPILGELITLSGAPTAVIGVLPATFAFPLRGDAELLVPYLPDAAALRRRDEHSVDVIARLAPDATMETARAELDAIGRGIAQADERYHKGSTAVMVPLADEMVGSTARMFGVLGASAALVLVIACANAAMLLMLRVRARARELSMRAALGASRGRLLRQLLAESLLLCAAAGTLALVIAQWSVKAATSAVPASRQARMPGFGEIGLSFEVILFVGAAVAASAIALTFAAAWQAVRALSLDALREDSRTSSATPARRQVTMIFVAAQLALAMTVLSGAALLLQSVRRLVAVSPGFAVENVLTFRLGLTTAEYPATEAALTAHDLMIERLASLPGVLGAGSTTDLPLTGRGSTSSFAIAGRPPLTSDEPSAAIRSVSSTYFRTMGIPVLAGRALASSDTASSQRVVVVNRTLADSVFGRKAAGERLVFPGFDGAPEWQIVGVVGDERLRGLDWPPIAVVYFPRAQSPARGFNVVVRTSVDAASMSDEAASTIASINPRLPVADVSTMEQLRASEMWRTKYLLWLVGTFAALALALAAIGVYGVVGQSVADRRREFGIRLALGATRRDVMSMTLRQGIAPVATGLAAGLGGALLLAPALEALLFEARRSDGIAVAAAAGMLAVCAGAACAIPAHRAANTDPAVTLRG